MFRRPLASAEWSPSGTVCDDNLTGGDIKVGLEFGTTALLTSPRFHHRAEAGTSVEDLSEGANSADDERYGDGPISGTVS